MIFQTQILKRTSQTWQTYRKYVRFPKIIPFYTHFEWKTTLNTQDLKKKKKKKKKHFKPFFHEFDTLFMLHTYSAQLWKKYSLLREFLDEPDTPSWHSSAPPFIKFSFFFPKISEI